MFALRVPRHGGLEVLTPTEIDEPVPSAGELVVQVTVAGVNFLDVYQRTGATPRQTPFTLGVEGVGIVQALDPGVRDFTVGDRVGWFSGGSGSCAELAVIDAARAVKIPSGITDDQAISTLMQGTTAHYLASDTYTVSPGDTVLVHAGAGGLGQLLTQVVKVRGGRVIATASTPEKAQSARANGADEVFSYDDFAHRVVAATDGQGVAAVYDGVGATTFEGSLASLRKRGFLIIYGTASGPTPPLDLRRLLLAGSVYVTRPGIGDYTSTTEELRSRVSQVFKWLELGTITASVGCDFAMTEARLAFGSLESRSSVGKIVLRPTN